MNKENFLFKCFIMKRVNFYFFLYKYFHLLHKVFYIKKKKILFTLEGSTLNIGFNQKVKLVDVMIFSIYGRRKEVDFLLIAT